MILNSTSAGYKNLTNGQVEEFMRRHSELRRLAEIPWGIKGQAREHSVVKLGGLSVNYFDKNIRNDPLLRIQWEKGGHPPGRAEAEAIPGSPHCNFLPFVLNAHYLIIGMDSKL